MDKEYVDARTTGFEAAWESCAAWWPERVEAVTGVPVADMRRAVRMLAGARRAHVLTGRGAEQHSKGSDTVAAFIGLALALGLPGRAGSGFGTLTGQGNGQGGREMGQKADQLPGYRSLTDPADRAHVASVWGVDPDALPGPGPSAYELLDSLGTPEGPRALLVFGSNPVVSAPRAAHVTERLSALDLLVVADFVPSETAALADVVLPVAQWAEEEGTLTGLEGRVLRRRAHLSPPPGVRTDLELLHALAVRLGQPPSASRCGPGRSSTSCAGPRRAPRRTTPGSATRGSTPGRRCTGRARPCPAATIRARPGRSWTGSPIRTAGPGSRPSSTGRPPASPTPGSRCTGRPAGCSPSTSRARRPAGCRSWPRRRRRRSSRSTPTPPGASGLADGALAEVESVHGSTRARVRVTRTAREDTVFVPFHYPGGARANLFTGDALDPRSRMPEFKVSAVRVTPVGERS